MFSLLSPLFAERHRSSHQHIFLHLIYTISQVHHTPSANIRHAMSTTTKPILVCCCWIALLLALRAGTAVADASRANNNAAAAAAAGGCAGVPIVIVGAGAAGIAAATRLWLAGCRNVTVLEADASRLGGRVRTVPFDGGVVDLGAQW